MRGPVLRALAMAVVVLAMADAEAGRFVVEKKSLRVTSPKELEGKYECAIGNFGVPQYGGTLHGSVVYPKSNKKACKGFDDFDVSFMSTRSGGRPKFVLIDREDCYFTTKAWNARNAGAAAILVVDNKVEPLITMDNKDLHLILVVYLLFALLMVM